LKGQIGKFLILFYKFNNACLVTNKKLKNIQDKRIVVLIFNTKRHKKGIDGGKWEVK
jgi:hypothetical protein